MSLRRFLNVVENRRGTVYALCRINLSRHDLFYPTTPPPPPNGNRAGSAASHAALGDMESIRLPAPSIQFEPTPAPELTALEYKMDCFALSESKIICTDQSARAFLYDADLRRFHTMPSLHAPKRVPISFSIPGAGDKQDGASLYVMEDIPRPDRCQFEAFVYCKTKLSESGPSWHCYLLPPPPYVHESGYQPTMIDSYAVLGNGSHICISTAGIGTFCFDTASRTWWEAGNWVLPFFGKAEYIPEHNLWFGESARDNFLCASDLSSVLKGRKPRLCNVWRVRDPPEWESFKQPELINLGSGRICIAKFFHAMRQDSDDFYEQVIDQRFVVFTGVEVVPCGDEDKPSGNGSGSGNGNDSESGSGNANGDGSGSGNANGDGSGSGNANGSGSGSGSGNGNGNDSGKSNANGNGKGKGKGGLRMINHKSKRYTLVGRKLIEAVL